MSRRNRLHPLAGLLAAGLAAPGAAVAASQPFPTYTAGLQPNGSYVVSTGQIITPAGTQVSLGIRVRAKAVAVNPDPKLHIAAVLTLGADAPIQVIDTLTGQVMQKYLPFQDSSGSYGGLSFSADGKYLMFGQDSSNVTVASVGPTGLLTDYAHIPVPPDTSLIKCFPNSPAGPYGRPCGMLYTTSTSYPGGTAFSRDGKSAYAILNNDDTLQSFDLTKSPPVLAKTVRVGNAPNSILMAGDTAFISNEGGRPAVASDFQIYSAGTPIVADSINASAVTGTVSVVNLAAMRVVANINVGLHPTGMAQFGPYLYVANTYSDTISVVDKTSKQVVRTISLGLPIAIPGQTERAYGAGPTGMTIDPATGIAYVALYNANAVAVVDLNGGTSHPLMGMIPVAFAPGSVALDRVHQQIIVANDKGIGTLGSFETDHGVTGFNTHQDTGTVSIVKLPTTAELAKMTRQVFLNNHWDLKANIASASGGSSETAPVAIPANIGDPSLIKHVFLIIRENRTYDQILGDVAAGNGDAQLAVFGGKDTPNMHNIVTRFPLLDNFYDPSRQSADGHQWIVEAMAPYADDIQSPDWVRSYPGGNAGDSLAYTKKGFLFQESVAAGLPTKIYGEYAENESWITPPGKPDWQMLYADALAFEHGKEPTLKYQNNQTAYAEVPVVKQHLIPNFPMFDLNIPDQWRVDLWKQDYKTDVANGTVPALSILWIMADHTGGCLQTSPSVCTPLTPDAEQADNDLAVGRIIETISHSSVWKDSAIFIEEDDAQNGVDHIDGHRSPGYIVSPYAVQGGPTDHTYYTQVNMTRTIEQILGLQPLNQYDLIASPMTTDFTNTPNFAPFTHLPAQVPLDQTVATANSPMAQAWEAKRAEMFAGKANKPDSEDSVTLNHLTWYEATGFTRPYPGEKTVRPPSDFANRLAPLRGDD
jgi:YVTN family beta-propeller protein